MMGMSSQAIFHTQIIQKAWEDPRFMELLKSNPKQALQEMMGISFPEHVKLTTIEETPQELYLVIPPKPSDVAAYSRLKTEASW
jgi:hypothetical protein